MTSKRSRWTLLPDLDNDPQDLGEVQGDSDTADPLDQEELLDEVSFRGRP